MPGLLDWDTPPRLDEAEWIDDEHQPYEDFRASMTDVRRANRFLGGTVVVTRQARRWIAEAKARNATAPLTFLDVATGSGDIPEAVLRLARRAGVEARFIGLDFSAPILRFAREEVGAYPEIRLIRGDAFCLPLPDKSVDYALCSLAFHHFGFERCLLALSEMERVSRRGWLVNDLRRARSAWRLFRGVSTLARMNRLTRHDGPASVMRAYSLSEYAKMVSGIGLEPERDVQIRGSLFYRVALLREKARGNQILPESPTLTQHR